MNTYIEKIASIIPKNDRKALTVLFSTLFSLLTILGKKITFAGNICGDFNANFIEKFVYSDIMLFVGWGVLFYIGLSCIVLIFRENNKIHNLFTNKTLFFKNKIIFGSIIFCLILLCWLPYILTLYPCCLLPDTLSSINQAMGNASLNNHHPILFTFIVKFFLTIGSVLHLNTSDSMFLFSFSQTLFFAFTITYFIIWLAKRGVNQYLCYLILAYFLFSPVFVFYAMQIQKDTLFSLMCFHITLILGDIVSMKENYFTDKLNVLKLILTLFLIIFLRNNGIYIVIIILAGIFIILPKFRKRISLSFAIFMVGFLIVTGPVYKNNGLKGAAAELYGIPLQQIGRTIVYKGNVSTNDLEFINKILPLEDFENCYKPCLVDPIKWSGNFNNEFLRDNQAKFLLIWAKNLPSNLTLYTEAFLMNTFGFWAFGEKNSYGYLDTYVFDNDYGIERINLLEKWVGINMENWISKYDYWGSGTLFWILLLSVYLLVYYKKYRKITMLMPCFAVWLSIMVATPVAFSLRYVFVLALSLPLLLTLPCLSLNKNNIQKSFVSTNTIK